MTEETKDIEQGEQVEPQEKPPMPYYQWCKSHDVLEWLRPLWEQHGWVLRQDGKLSLDTSSIAINTPWRHVKQAYGLDCGTWHRLLFELISNRLPPGEKFVPSQCQNCWKVVVRPQTLKQLFALEKLQIALDLPSKCGIEVRPSVHGLYGGYFYNIGIEAGVVCYKKIRKAINEDKHLGPDVPVILKRACTEFEHAVGPSDKWEITPEQMVMERLVDTWVTKDDFHRYQHGPVIWHLHRRWIEYAYAQGDETYLEFTGNEPLYPPYVAYHHLADEVPDA